MQRTKVRRDGGHEIHVDLPEKEEIKSTAIKLVRILARQVALEEKKNHANMVEGGEE